MPQGMVNGGTEMTWRNKQEPTKRECPSSLLTLPRSSRATKPRRGRREKEGREKKKRKINPLETRKPTD